MFRDLRRKDKRMDKLTTMNILEKASEGVLSTFGEDGYPYGVVLNYVYYQEKIYFHCAKVGHKIDNIIFHDKVSFSIYQDVNVIGQALTTHYRSVLVFGRAKLVETRKDILLALIDKYADIERDQAKKMIAKEINLTGLVEIEIDHISGKIGVK